MSRETYAKIWGWVTVLAIIAIVTTLAVVENKRVKDADYGEPVNCVETPDMTIVGTEFENDPTLVRVEECFLTYNEYNKNSKKTCKTWEVPQ